MQTLRAELDRHIDLLQLEDYWQGHDFPSVRFSLQGLKLQVTVLGQHSPWDKENFRTTVKLAVHGVDRDCRVKFLDDQLFD